MIKERLLWQLVEQHLLTGQKVALLLVLDSQGSSPGRAGFKLALSQSGDMCGSIGGGIMEVKLTELAKSLLKKGDFPVIITQQIHHKKAGKNQSGMICSGEQTIAIACINDSHLPTIKILNEALRANKPVALVAQTAERQLVLLVEHTEPPATLLEGKQNGENDFYYKEYLGPVHTLYIIGGGHCALALSELMAKLGFFVVVLDDRPQVNTLKSNTFAHQIHVIDSYAHVAKWVQPGRNVYTVIMTLGYAGDLLALRQIVHLPFTYLGLLGSKAKTQQILASLHAEGVPEAQISRIHAPVGLPIHSHTPEEIAVSIAAEIIAVKNRP